MGLNWPMVRHDSAFTGRALAVGKITKPVIKDKLFAGAFEGLAVVRPGAASMTAAVSEEVQPDYWAVHASEWNTEGVLATPKGEGFEASNGGFVKLIPEIDAPQRLDFENGSVAVTSVAGYLHASDGPDGQERVVWRTETEQMMHGPTVLITDADGDGVPEVVVATWYRVMIYDSRTGVKKTELRWHEMRNYGYFGCFTVPGERFPKFVIVADFASHIDVLDNDGKNLSVLWRKDLEHTILCKEKITRVGPNPIADIDGDGRFEITVSLFDHMDDKQWHVCSFDALTGAIRFDIPGAYLRGMADMDGDGLPELFIQDTDGPVTPRFGPIRLVSLRGGKQQALWSHQRAAWQTTDLTVLPFTSNTLAIGGRRTVLVAEGIDGRAAFAVAPCEDDRESLVSIEHGADGKWSVRSTVTGPRRARMALKAVGTNPPHPNPSFGSAQDVLPPSGGRGSRSRIPLSTHYLIAWRSDGDGAQELTTDGASVEVVSYHAVPGPTAAPVVARLRENEPPTLIFQDGIEQLAAYRKSESGWNLRWRRLGRGMTYEGKRYYGVIVADLDGDGEMETVFASSGPSGEARIVAVDPDGNVRWKCAFPGFDGAAPIFNMSGLTWWNVGHFTSREHLDVFVNPRRSTMHSYEGFLVSGKDGSVIWRQGSVEIDEHPGNSRGYGGLLTAAADVNGDGLDELICANPDRFWIASGVTGEIGTIACTDWQIFPGLWIAYGTPVVADFQGSGEPQVLWGACDSMAALMGTDGKPIWYGECGDGTGVASLQGIAKADESGRLLIGGAGYKDGFRCIDPADGSVIWTYPLPGEGSAGFTISADVNGDGIEEFVFAHGTTIHAINGKGGKANIIWSIDLPGVPGHIAFADADGDGKPEIVAGASDGYVYVIGD